MKLLINAVESVALAGFLVQEINLCFAVAIHAPTHAQVSKLVHFIHILYISVTGLALNVTHFYVLAVVKVHMVWQVVDAHPLNRTGTIR